MRSEVRAIYICRKWHEIGIRQRHYLSDVPYEDLAPEHRAALLKRSLLYAKGHRFIPFVVMKDGEPRQLW